MNKISKSEALHRIAEQAVPGQVDLWPRIREQLGSAATPRRTTGHSGRRRVVLAAAAAVLLALAVGAAWPLWNTATPVSAETILVQAQAASANPAAAIQRYHLKLIRQFPGKGNATITTEIWFAGSDRQRGYDEERDANGSIVSRSDVVFNGAEVWIARMQQGQTWVVHTTGTIWTAPTEDPSQMHNLTDALRNYIGDKACRKAELQGEGSVAGQATYVVVLTPLPGGCAPLPANPADEAKARAAQAAKAGATACPSCSGRSPSGAGAPNTEDQVGQMVVWVDKVSFLPLKTEVRNAAGAVLDRSEVTSVEYNVPLADSVFAYTPPAGATVSTFSGGTGADVKKAMCGMPPQGNNCPPPQAPSK